MSPSSRSGCAPSSRKPLVACVIAILGLPASAAFAGTVVVNNCSDSGTGSLRWAVGPGVAASGDSIDMTGLTVASPGCAASSITLTTGEIAVYPYDLTIEGPGTNNLEVTANFHSRIFHHYGAGKLAVKNLTIGNGTISGTSSSGGCIYSTGSVWLYKARVHYCEAHATSGYAQGGAIFALKDLWMEYSVLAYNFATSSSHQGKGGAALVGGKLTAKYSTIRENYSAGSGGALWTISPTTEILNSTLEGNTAAGGTGGALYLIGSTSTASATITDSTISGNSAHYAGGIFADAKTVTISNSTIVFNTATAVGGAFGANAPGLAVMGYGPTPTAKLESTLVANNTWGFPPTELDLSATAVTISGDHNLVRTASAVLPPGTITGQCPLLGPLRFNGGWTRTHALLSRSPGIDQGSNSKALTVDQRGPSFARGSPTAALPDIGAYEVQKDDIVFNAGFEGCP